MMVGRVVLIFAALGASINFIQCLESATDRDKFQDLLPAMMRTLTESLNSGEEATAQEALELMIELAGTEPRFLRKQLVDVVSAMLQIAEADGLEEATRHLAVEFVITLAEARERAPGMIRKLPQFVGRLFAVLMKMLLDIEDEQAWHGAEVEDEDAGETSNYSVGQECLDRLSIALGGNTIVPVASELLPAYLAAPEWQKHHAALITLAQIAEGCSVSRKLVWLFVPLLKVWLFALEALSVTGQLMSLWDLELFSMKLLFIKTVSNTSDTNSCSIHSKAFQYKTWEKEKAEFEQLKSEAERKYNEDNDQLESALKASESAPASLRSQYENS